MLEGIRVIDFSQYLPGPHATLRLVDMGAEVIKVESPQGDPSRASAGINGNGFVFLTQNRNKKSVVLDLKDPIDRKNALNLISEADVVLESFRPGVTDRLGIGYEQAIQVKKDIIYCSLSGYGQTGSMSHLGGHDINYMSISGLLAQLKDEKGRPVQPSTTIADFVGGISASEAILGALVKKLRTGEGSYIDLSITDSLFSLMSNHILIEHATGEQHGISKLNNKYVCYFLYETKDNRFVSLGALEAKFWRNFCTALNKEHWISEHFSLAQPSNPVFEEMKEVFANKTLAQWTQFSHQVDCCLAPVLETGELYNHPLIKDRGLIVEKEEIRYTATKYPAIEDYYTAPPKFGQHSDQVKEQYERKV
ncbi:CoA transferase [Bacillus sp. JJ634]